MIYSFGIADSSFPTGNASMKDELGGKGANLAEMASLGIPVPPGFTFPCSYSVEWASPGIDKEIFRADLEASLESGMHQLAVMLGYVPLVSVRSGARVSMPGMMDTILNVGLCKSTLPFWSMQLGPRAALDSYRRLIQMYSSVVLGVPISKFEAILAETKKAKGFVPDTELESDDLEELVEKFLAISPSFPQTPGEQLIGAVCAVFDSWNNERAIEYRKIYNIPASWGTAANVQAMVFGNMGNTSCTGVLFSRCPSTGDFGVVGEFLVNAQGEDVVAGVRTPEPLKAMAKWNKSLHKELSELVVKLENHYKDMQDIEFTVQNNKLYILQTRSGKRSAVASFVIAASMVEGGIITLEEAKARLSRKALLGMISSSINPKFKTAPDLVGVAAGGSVVSGVAVFSAADAINCKEPCILITSETDPDDIAGMNVAVGILTATGGLTSHAAVVARGMNKTCVVGATDMKVDIGISASAGGKSVSKGDLVTIDGTTGNVWFKTKVPVIQGRLDGDAVWLLGKLAGTLRFPVEDTSYEGLLALLGCVDNESVIEVDAAPFNESTILNLVKVVEFYDLHIILNMTPPVLCESIIDRMQLMHSGGLDINAVWMASLAPVLSCLDASQKARFTLRGNAPSLLSVLKKKGFSVVGFATTVADLMDSHSSVSFSPELIEKVFGTQEAFQYVLACLKKDGKLASAPSPHGIYWFEAI